MRLFAFIIGYFVFYSSAAFALIIETQPMSFGSFAITNNNAQYDYTINPNGTTINDPELLVISTGQEASYDVSAFPASTILIIIASSTGLQIGGIGESFDVLNFQYLPSPTTTDGAGNATFTLGGTLRTSGSTIMYLDGNYTGDILVSVNF